MSDLNLAYGCFGLIVLAFLAFFVALAPTMLSSQISREEENRENDVN